MKYNIEITEVNDDGITSVSEVETLQPSLNEAWTWVFEQLAIDSAVNIRISECK